MSQDTGLFSVKRPREVVISLDVVAKSQILTRHDVDTRECSELLFPSTASFSTEAHELGRLQQPAVFFATPSTVPIKLSKPTSAT